MARVIYNEGLIIEVTIREGNGSKIETKRCNVTDSKAYGRILKYLKLKYNASPTLDDNFLNMNSEFWKF